ncbi:MAG TPA: ABC transporter permease [Roseiflexaceae bacterium]|nr:ABC transporter permease [Roseiflexaceae bacterium]
MARLAIPSGWAGALIRQRGPLRTYQWLWLLLCAVGALIVAAPRILSQPVVYASSATATFDARRYGGLLTNGQPNGEYAAVERIAVELLRASRDGDTPRYPGLGGPTLGVRYEPQPDGGVRVVAIGSRPALAQRLAEDAAEALARSIRAAGGREIFRILTGSYLYSTLVAGRATTDPFQQQLRTIYLTSAFPLNRPPDPDARQITANQLAPEERSDLARALEVRDVELSRRDLPALQERIAAAGLDCRADRRARQERADSQCLEEQRLIDGLVAIRSALGLLNAPFDPGQASSAYRSAPAAPGTEIPRHTAPLLALATLVGLVLGGVGVAVDRSAGVMSKLRELWNYRELIRNLVLRDLRVRYKGSALGYLWTQLAPLLMMAVFWFVFSFVQPQQIAMFPVFLIVGLLPWNFCNEAVAGGARSVIDNANLIKKVFFPREVLPLVSVFSSMVNFLLSLPMMFLVMAIVQLLYPPLREQGRLFNFAPTLAYLPVLIVIQALFLAGVALFMSALAVHFRDFVHLIGILLQFWFFLTPVVYALDVLSVTIGGVALAQVVRWLNPMASLIEFYREVLYGNTVFGSQVPTPGLPALTSVLRVLITALVVLTIGYWFFQRRSGQFGEEI